LSAFRIPVMFFIYGIPMNFCAIFTYHMLFFLVVVVAGCTARALYIGTVSYQVLELL
jgi:hypothetical protein